MLLYYFRACAKLKRARAQVHNPESFYKLLKIVCIMENSYEFKEIRLLKKKGSLVGQEESSVFLLSVILEEFIFEYEDDSKYVKEIALAKRLDNFLLNGNLVFIE